MGSTVSRKQWKTNVLILEDSSNANRAMERRLTSFRHPTYQIFTNNFLTDGKEDGNRLRLQYGVWSRGVYLKWNKVRCGCIRKCSETELEYLVSQNTKLLLRTHTLTATLTLRPGNWYELYVTAVHTKGRGDIIAESCVKFKTIASKKELSAIYEKATSLASKDMSYFKVFYKTKPESFWKDTTTIVKCVKDANGDIASPINELLSGVLFQCNVQSNGSLPTVSPYGDTRFSIDASYLLNDQFNLYFADFYCQHVKHWVTLVLSRRGSEVDTFCKRYLLPLNKQSNPFMCRPYRGEFLVQSAISIEVLFTEDVPVEDGTLKSLPLLSSDHQGRPQWIAKNAQCVLCNLAPMSRSSAECMYDQLLDESVQYPSGYQ